MTKQERFMRFASTVQARADLRGKSVRGAMFTAASSGIDLVLRFASTLVLARLLIPEHFGLIGMVTAVTGIAEQFSTMGLSTATIQASEITHKQCSNLFWINVIAGGAFGLLICALAPIISSFYQDARLSFITIAIATNFLWGGLTVQHEALLNRQMKQPQVSVNRLVANLLSTFGAVVLAFTDHGYWALVWREVLRSILIAAGVWLLCPWLPGTPRRGASIGSLLRIGRDLTFTDILIAIVSRLDGIVIGKFAGPIALGLYRQAYYLIMTPVDQFNTPINRVSQPGLSMLQAEPERYRRYYQRILFVISLATIPLGAFSAIYAEEIVSVVLGQKWVGTAIFIQIFSVAAAIRPVIGTSALVLITCGRSGRFLVLAIAHSVLLVILMVAGIPWGAEGIAIACVGTTVFIMFPKLYYSFSGTPVALVDFFKIVWRPILSSAVMAIALTVLRGVAPLDGALVCLIVGGGTAILVYLVSFVLVPGGWVLLWSLFKDVISALQIRSSEIRKETSLGVRAGVGSRS